MGLQRVVISSVVLVLLAVSTNEVEMNSHQNMRNSNSNTRVMDLHSVTAFFQSFFARLAGFFHPGPSRQAILHGLTVSKQQQKQPQQQQPPPPPQPQRDDSSVVARKPTKSRCNPPCGQGHCCLKKKSWAAPRCEKMLLSGSVCGWSHYTKSSPSNTVPLNREKCPCMRGMACLMIKGKNRGVCSFL